MSLVPFLASRRSNRLLWATALLSLSVPSSAFAGLNSWTTNGPTGGGLGLAIDSANQLVLYAPSLGGVFKTTDGGLIWRHLDDGLPPGEWIVSIATDPGRSDLLYGVTSVGALVKSMDSALSWARIFESDPTSGLRLSVYQVVIAPVDDRILYARTSGGVFRSADGGESWQGTGLNTSVRTLAIDPTDPSKLWAGTTGGTQGLAAVVLRSEDSGMTWTSSELDSVVPHSGNAVFAIAVQPGTHRVFASTRSGIFAGGGRVSSIGRLASCFVFDQSNPSIIYACGAAEKFFDEGLGVLKSVDGGATWNSVGPAAQTWVTSIVLDPGRPATIYAAAGGPAPYPGEGVFKSLDAGGHWDPAMTGLSAHFVWTVEAARARPGEIYAGVSSSFPARKSSDEGTDWQIVSTGITDPYVLDFAVNPTMPQIVYAGGPHVWKSEDGGTLWRQTSLPQAFKYVLAVDPRFSFIVYAATSYFDSGFFPFDGGVYRSLDFGQTWAFSAAGLDSTDSGRTIFELAVHPNGTIYAATGAGIYRSSDGGISWVATVLSGNRGVPISSVAVDPMNSSMLYAASFAGDVFRSTDSGITWALLTSALRGTSIRSIVADPVRPRIVYVCSDAGVFRSADAGANWSSMNAGLKVLNIRALAFSTSGTILHAASGGGGVYDFEFLPERVFFRSRTVRPAPRTLAPRF